jgi:hypothetical protein
MHYFYLGVALLWYLLAVEQSCCDCVEVKVSKKIVPMKPISRTSAAPTTQYLNVRQCKLGFIIIQTLQ